MKVDKIFHFIINFLVCISITIGSREIKQAIEKYQIADDFSNEDFDYQDNLILSLENSREEEEPQVVTEFQRKKEIDSYEQLKDSGEIENSRYNEIQKENKNLKITPKSAFISLVSNMQENFNVAEDASRMISVIGSLEESIEDATENILNGKMVKNETEMFPRNMNIPNEIKFNQILSKVNQKLKKLKKISAESKEDESFVNRIEANIAANESEIENVQTLKLKWETKKVINPHLGETKSYFEYKEALKEKEARKNSLKESISKKPSK